MDEAHLKKKKKKHVHKKKGKSRTISANSAHELHSTQQTDGASAPKAVQVDAAGGLWPKAQTLSQTRAVNAGLNGAPF